MKRAVQALCALLTIIAILFVVLVGIWIVWASFSRARARANAINEFRLSRGVDAPSLDSRDFALRGVQGGFDEDQVDACMEGATFRTERTYLPGAQGSVKSYFFTYGRFRVPLLESEFNIVSEHFTIHFDENGRAVKADRWLVVKGGVRPLPGEGHSTWLLAEHDNSN